MFGRQINPTKTAPYALPEESEASEGWERDIRRRVVSYAMLAPNPHNVQPWRVKLTGPSALDSVRRPGPPTSGNGPTLPPGSHLTGHLPREPGPGRPAVRFSCRLHLLPTRDVRSRGPGRQTGRFGRLGQGRTRTQGIRCSTRLPPGIRIDGCSIERRSRGDSSTHYSLPTIPWSIRSASPKTDRCVRSSPRSSSRR